MMYLKSTTRNYISSCNNFEHTLRLFLWNKHLTFCSVMRFTQVLLYKNNDTDSNYNSLYSYKTYKEKNNRPLLSKVYSAGCKK